MKKKILAWQIGLLIAIFVVWHLLTVPGLIPPIFFDNENKASFFFGEPLKIFSVIWVWFKDGEIYPHLWVTLQETVLAFGIGTVLGLVIGLWLGLSNTASAVLDPYIKAMNAMPRVILAPIFMVWFGLGIWSKVALGVTLVFFIVFFNVYQGVIVRSYCVTFTCRPPPRGCFPACILPSAWRLSARWWANIWAAPRASAISFIKPKARLISTPCSPAFWC